ncbi:MAG: 50S ribosomal protein L3 [Acidobacteriota bacterium]
MIEGMIGKKIAMTQIFQEDGVVVPVTVMQAGPCVVVQRKTKENDGYDVVQIGLVETRKKKVNKPLEGHFKKANVPPARILREFRLEGGATVNPGDKVLVSLFKDVEKVDVTGTSKGLGFTGVIRRHGFRGGAATHGSMFHRAPGSIGSSSFPSRVFKGMRMGGREGNRRVTVRNLRVMQVDEEKNLLVVKGAVPGPTGSTVIIRKAKGLKKGKN